jgi:hypothetical protein
VLGEGWEEDAVGCYMVTVRESLNMRLEAANWRLTEEAGVVCHLAEASVTFIGESE